MIPTIFAEANLPASLDDSAIGDDHLRLIMDRPYDWRLRMPALDPILEENMILNEDQVFQCDPLDGYAAFSGFAAFADGEDDQYNRGLTPAIEEGGFDPNASQLDWRSDQAQIDNNPTYQDYWGDPNAKQPASRPVVSRAPASTGNNAIDILSGLLKDVTPAATQYATNRLGTGNKKPAAAAPRASAPTAANKNITPIIIAVVAIGAGMMFLSSKK